LVALSVVCAEPLKYPVLLVETVTVEGWPAAKPLTVNDLVLPLGALQLTDPLDAAIPQV
jgi:hypothetical protein